MNLHFKSLAAINSLPPATYFATDAPVLLGHGGLGLSSPMDETAVDVVM